MGQALPANNPAASAVNAEQRFQSKLAMDPHGKNVDGSAIGVEAGIYDVLQIAREPKRLTTRAAVKHIQAGFGGSLNGPVTDKTIDAAKRQVFRMNLGDPI